MAGLLAAVTGALGSLPAALAGVPGQIGPYRVELTTNPAVIPVGNAHLNILVMDATGKPIEGARVRALVKMTAMSMGEAEIPAAPEPGHPGNYTTTAAFMMAGVYDANLSIQGPEGTAGGTVKLQTGQNTKAGRSHPGALPWAIVLLFAVFVLYRMRITRQHVNWGAIASRGTLAGVALLAGMLGVSGYAVHHWRRSGAMTPIQAQAMQMDTPAPPGAATVTLAAVTRGPVVSTMRYTGQAVGFAEEDVNVRTPGWLIRMPYYVGDHVRAGQLLAQLDTSQQNPQVAQQQAAVNVASSGVEVARHDYQQAVAAVNQAKADVQGKRDAQAAAEVDIRSARLSESAAEADLLAVRTQLVSTRAAVDAANQDLTATEQQEVNQKAELKSTQADQQYWQQEIAREKSLLARGAVSLEEYQRELSEASRADARVRQAEAGVEQTEAQTRAARARVQETRAAVDQARAQILSAEAQAQKAESAVAYSLRKAAQSRADVLANRASVQSAQATAEAARQRIFQSEAGVQQAQAMLTGATTSRDYSEVFSPLDGVLTQRLVSPGTLVNPGQAIYRVAQISPIRIQANVAQEDLDRVKVGAPVVIRGADDRSAPVEAKVTSITPAVDPVARTGVVEAVTPNKDTRFLPGQYTVMDIAIGGIQDALRVSSAAIRSRPVISSGVLSSGPASYVWVADPVQDEQGRFTVRQVVVQTGVSDDKNTAILSGLREGEQVVVSGGDYLKDGDTVVANNPPAQPAPVSASPGSMAGMDRSAVVTNQTMSGMKQTMPGMAAATGPAAPGGAAYPEANAAQVEVSSRGFAPPTITLSAGVPARLTFVRKDTQNCATEVSLPDYGIRKALPLNQPVTVQFNPRKGEIAFSCGMGMLKGTVIAR